MEGLLLHAAGYKHTCSIGITALHKFELPAAVDDEVLSPPTEMGQVGGGSKQGLQHKVPVADSIHGVGADPSNEAQVLGKSLPVHAKGVASQRPAQPTPSRSSVMQAAGSNFRHTRKTQHPDSGITPQ